MKFWIFLLTSAIVFGCTQPTSIEIKKVDEPQIIQHNPETIPTKNLKSIEAIPELEKNEIERYFKNFVRRRRFNGQIVVAKNGQIVFDTVNGYANIRKRIKLTDTSSMQLASITKTLTATVVLQLLEEEKIKLNDSLTRFLPDLPEHYQRIKIKHLLAHQSGLAQYYYYCDHVMDNKEHFIYNDTVLCVINFHNPDHYYPPGRKYNYSNTNYVLLASVIESIEKKPYKTVLKERIFDKSGMKNSFVFDYKDTLPSNFVLGHNKWNRPFDLDYLDGIVGDKGIYSNALDLLKFDQHIDNFVLLSDSVLNLAHSEHNKVRFKKSYGLGWRIKYVKNIGKVVYHTGWWHGNRHIYMKLPNGYTVIILSNALRGSIYNMNKILENFEYPAAKEKPVSATPPLS